VAGQFYEGDRRGLERQIEACFLHELGPGELPEEGGGEEVPACVVPHAGYMYSGPVAANVYRELKRQGPKELYIIISPNHTGRGSAVATLKDAWETPLGKVEADAEAIEFLFKDCKVLDLDENAHMYEHSVEVQLPFLQYLFGSFSLVPVTMGLQDLETSSELAESISKLERDFTVIASSDFSHYEPQEVASRKDRRAIEAILNLDEKRFIQRIHDENISACGYGPIATAIMVAKKRGAKRARLLKYATSGDITKDYSQVVGYAGIALEK